MKRNPRIVTVWEWSCLKLLSRKREELNFNVIWTLQGKPPIYELGDG
jgi:hypothetical protein